MDAKANQHQGEHKAVQRAQHEDGQAAVAVEPQYRKDFRQLLPQQARLRKGRFGKQKHRQRAQQEGGQQPGQQVFDAEARFEQ